MDSVTQAALGAAVGHLCWQDKLGRKSLIAGAMLATLPDLDILLFPVLDEVQRLYWHRGESHSIWFLVLGSISIGWLLKWYYKEKQLTSVQAIAGVFLVLSTHVLIDLCNVYGTQLLSPISRKGFALNNIFIIDPLFTLPLLFCSITAYFIKNQPIAVRINKSGLLIASLYLASSFLSQSIADQKFRIALKEQNNHKISRQITSAAPFTTFLWRHIAETPEGFLLGYWSWFDDNDRHIHFHYIPKNAFIVKEIESTRTFKAVDWFSKGWWFVAESNTNTAKIVDLRFTELPTVRGEPYTKWQWPFAWVFNLNKQDQTPLKAVPPDLQDPVNSIRILAQRIQGKDGWNVTVQ